MIVDFVLFFAGLVILYYGAEYLVRGAASTAVMLGVSPVIVGLTVVAFGTSMPELVASLIAVKRGASDIALGNVVGSNISNIGLVLGVGALIYPFKVSVLTLRRELPFMLTFTFVVMAMCRDGMISRPDGAILFLGLLLFTVYCVVRAIRFEYEAQDLRSEVEEEIEGTHSLPKELLLTVAGIIGVMLGAKFLVDSSISIARTLGVSELVIGVTIVAVGTSLPELATTAVAAYRRHSGIAVGNIIGSNIFNIGMILGVTSFLSPLAVSRGTLFREMAVMAVFSLALAPMMLRMKIGRFSGGILLAGYAAFILWVAFFRSSI